MAEAELDLDDFEEKFCDERDKMNAASAAVERRPSSSVGKPQVTKQQHVFPGSRNKTTGASYWQFSFVV